MIAAGIQPGWRKEERGAKKSCRPSGATPRLIQFVEEDGEKVRAAEQCRGHSLAYPGLGARPFVPCIIDKRLYTLAEAE